jgi:polyphenol oxidase
MDVESIIPNMYQNNIIRSKIFKNYPDLVMGISTRHGGVSPKPLGMNTSYTVGDKPENVKENRTIFCASLGISVDDVVFQRQVHDTNIKKVDAPGVHDSCDALITNTAGIFLAVSIGDCLPILIYDPVNQVLAGIHAGWKGSRDRIVAKALDVLLKEFNSDASCLIAYIGPGAGDCCYEVGDEVACQFPAEFLSKKAGGGTHLDLKLFNRSILISAGIPISGIEVSEFCTICNPEIFHSHRRDKKLSGRMLAIIGMKKKCN